MCAGMYAGRSMLKAVVLERGFPGGELLNTELIEDYPGFESVLGHELAQKFADHAARFGAEFKNGVVVESVRKLADGSFETRTEAGDLYLSPTVIITAGGTPVKLGIPGELEDADFLTRYGSKVYLIHRRDELRASKILHQRLFANPKIEVIWNTVVESVQADAQGLVNSLTIRDVNTNVVTELAATGLFVFIGFR